jgi:hypothetical protein
MKNVRVLFKQSDSADQLDQSFASSALHANCAGGKTDASGGSLIYLLRFLIIWIVFQVLF